MAASRAAAAGLARPLSAHSSLSGLPKESGQSSAAWLTRLERRHVHALSLATLVLAVASACVSVSTAIELAVLVPAVTLLGLPHGAVDYVAGQSILGRFGRWWIVLFFGGYLGLAALTVAGWLLAPLTTLLFFLLISVWHFGRGDVDDRLALGANRPWSKLGAFFEAVARGGFFLTAALYFHTSDVSAMFASLTGFPFEHIIAQARAVGPAMLMLNGALLSVVLAHHLGGWAEGSDDHGRAALEVAALVALFCLAAPLVAFVVYFCFWHSVRHGLRLAAALDPSSPAAALRAFVRRAWPTTLAASLIGVAAFWLLGASPPTDALLRIVFVGLSALTVPHVVLTWLNNRIPKKHLR